MTLSDVNDSSARRKFLKEDFQNLISNLTASQKPIWGYMTAQQMVEHLIWTFDVSIGKIKVNCSVSPEKIGAYKKFLHSDIPTKQNFRNSELMEGLPELVHENMENAIVKLKASVEAFYDIYKTNPSKKEIHPIFDSLNFEEWERAHFKHCLHHLQQFGFLL